MYVMVVIITGVKQGGLGGYNPPTKNSGGLYIRINLPTILDNPPKKGTDISKIYCCILFHICKIVGNNIYNWNKSIKLIKTMNEGLEVRLGYKDTITKCFN